MLLGLHSVVVKIAHVSMSAQKVATTHGEVDLTMAATTRANMSSSAHWLARARDRQTARLV